MTKTVHKTLPRGGWGQGVEGWVGARSRSGWGQGDGWVGYRVVGLRGRKSRGGGGQGSRGSRGSGV